MRDHPMARPAWKEAQMEDERENDPARLRALLDERTALLRECLPIVDAAAMSVRGYPGEETPNDLSRRIAATLEEA